MTKIKIIILLLATCSYAQNNDDFKILSRKDSLNSYLLAKSQIPTSVTLKIKKKADGEILQKLIVPAKDSMMFLKTKSTDKEKYLKEIKEKYSFSYHFGDSISSSHDNKHLYNFPFGKGARYELIQSWGGKLSHNTPKSYHALDFKMNIGDAVHAARSGVVVRSIDKYTENGGRELQNFANTIIIKHDDNTFAHYVHLRPNGSLVDVGQQIESGALIGFSGNTGFSTLPHLHFVVMDGTGNSIPVYFKGFKNKKLKAFKKYKRRD